MPEYLNKEILVLGCGNLLFGDDGFGNAVVNRLDEMKKDVPLLASDKVGIIDAGTGSSHFILSLINEETPIKKIIIVDIIDYKLEPGTLKKLYPEDLPNIKKYVIDAHDMPLAGMLKDINEQFNVEIVIIGCQAKNMTAPDVSLELSEEVQNAIDKAIEMIIEEMESLGD